MNKESKARRLTAIDFFIIFAVIAVLVAAGFRIYGNMKDEDVETVVSPEEYIVSFECKGVKESTSKLLAKGDVFYLAEGDSSFGTLEENPTVTPAKIRVELENGELKNDVYAEKNGDDTIVDITGEMRIKGYRNNDGFTVVEDGVRIAPNLSLTAYRGDLALNFTITGIEKVS